MTDINKEIDRLVKKYPRPDSSELFRSELEYLVEQTIKNIWCNEWREESTEYHIKRILSSNNPQWQTKER